MPAIEPFEHHIIYDNPKPHVRSRHGFFPGLALLPSGDLLALFAIGEAFESPNSTTWVSRSHDHGRTWRLEAPLYDKSLLPIETSDYLKPTVLSDGSLVAVGYRYLRHDLESPIGIPETGGILPGENIVSFSNDEGRTWSVPELIPRAMPELLELSGPAVELASGDLAAVAALLPLPDGSTPSGRWGALLRSGDRGRTWTTHERYFSSPPGSIVPFEGRICEMQPGRLIALVWAYDAAADTSLPNQYVISGDNGITWSQPASAPHAAQASSLLWLGGDRLLTIHAHRGAEAGIFVRVVDLGGGEWTVLAEAAVYGTRSGAQTYAGQEVTEMFRSLRFGQPSLLALGGNEFLAAHWCIEDGQGKIRSHRLRYLS